MFELSSDLSSQVARVAKDTFTGTSSFVMFIIGLVLAFFVIELIIHWIGKGKE